jgi:hypothetical protein
MIERTNYDSSLADLFVQSYREAARAARNLGRSVERTAGLFPLSGSGLEQLDDDALERLDAFRVRYAQLQDMLAKRLFRNLLRLEEESIESMLDVVNAMEKRGVITSFDSWRSLRELRNTFMHDYPGNPELRAQALTRAHALAPELPRVLWQLRERAIRKIGLSPDQLPEVSR